MTQLKFAMHRWSIVALLLTISIKWKSYAVHGFLFTPKFQIFLNQLRQNQANQQFVVNWDFNNSYNSVNNNGFSYATNQNGMFMNRKHYIFNVLIIIDYDSCNNLVGRYIS